MGQCTWMRIFFHHEGTKFTKRDLRDAEKRDDDELAAIKKEDKELLSIGEIQENSLIQRGS